MNKKFIFAASVLAAAMFVGCEKKTDTEKAADSANKAAENAAKTMDGAAKTATDSTSAAAGKTAEANSAAIEKAKTLLDQGMQYVKDNKLDLAQKSLDELDSMKASLPAEWVPRIDQLRSALTAAKAAGGKLPGGMSIPGK